MAPHTVHLGSPRRPPSHALALGAALLLAACGGSAPTTLVSPEAEAEESGGSAATSASACEGATPMSAGLPDLTAPEEPLRCDELDDPPALGAAPATAAACRALPAGERSACQARVRALPRVARLVDQARAAERARDFRAALGAYQEALRIAPEEATVRADLGFARFGAHAWCHETQDLPALVDARESDPGASPLAQLCLDDATLEQARVDLTAALEQPLEQRAQTLHRLGQVLIAAGRYDDALPALRESLCLRDDAEARHSLAELLLTLGHAAGASAPEEAVAYYRQAQLVEPSAGTEGFVLNVLAALGETFALAPPPPVRHAGVYASVDELCQVLVGEQLAEPAAPDELPDDLCETGDWDDVGVAVGDDTNVFFQVTLLSARSPEVYDGTMATLHLVARTPRGVNVLLDLGSEHGDSRHHNAYVADIGTSFRFESADAPLFVQWTQGEASARDCDWESAAYSQFAACGLVGDLPRCFAWADLGPADYGSDTMLPTVQESLGRCDEDRPVRVATLDPSRFRPRYEVDFTEQELAVTRATDGAMTCLPLPDALTPLRRRAAAR